MTFNNSLKSNISVAQEILLGFLFVAILYICNGFVGLRVTVQIILLAIICISVFIIQTTLYLNKQGIAICLFLASNTIVTTLIVRESLDTAIFQIGMILFSFLIVSLVSFHSIADIYTKSLLITTSISLVVYACSVSLPALIERFPIIYNSNGLAVRNLGIAYVYLRSNPIRNFSFFWEPGAFQTFIVYALLFEIFVFKLKRKINIVIFFAALVTTWSTAGIINLLILVSIIMLYVNHEKKNKHLNVVVSIISFMALFFVIYSFLSSEMQYAILGKVTNYFISESEVVTSASVRFDSIIIPFREFLSSPLWGVGNDNLKDAMQTRGHRMTTNTIMNWFAVYGAFFGICMTYLVFKLARIFAGKSKLIFYLVILSLVLAISTEQYIRNMSVIMILFLPFSLRTGPDEITEPINRNMDVNGIQF